jgi:hypothetical protein
MRERAASKVVRLTSRPNTSAGGSPPAARAGNWGWEDSLAALLVAGCVASIVLGMTESERDSAVLLYFK